MLLKSRKKKNHILASTLIWSLSGPTANAAGFANYVLGADESSTPTFAHAVSPAATFWNPALLTRLEGTHLQAGVGFISPSREVVSDATGQSARPHSTTSVVPQIYASHRLSDTLALGFHFNAPFGLESEWDPDWEGRYIATKSKLTGKEAGLSIAWQATKRLSIGGGPRFLYVDGVLQRALDLGTFGLPDGSQRFSGDEGQLLWQLGAAFRLSPEWTFGINYRSSAAFTLEGGAEFSGIPTPLRPMAPDADGRAHLSIPAQLFSGLAYQSGRLTAEVGVRWEQWSDYDALRFDFDQPIMGMNTQSEPKHWNDTLAGLIGIRYDIRPDLGVRFGYVYEPTAVPDETLDYSVTDTDKQYLTLGMHWNPAASTRLSAAYTHGFYQDRHKSNDVGAAQGGTANGMLKQSIDILSLSITQSF